MVFVHDYHPGADTLMNQYFNQPSQTVNGIVPGYCDVDGLSAKSGNFCLLTL